jgi:hypothetical protein
VLPVQQPPPPKAMFWSQGLAGVRLITASEKLKSLFVMCCIFQL